VWFTRIVIGAAVYVGFMLGLNWRYAVSATALYLIGDVVFRSKTKEVIPASVRVTAAQKSTQRRLRMLQPAGYYALNTCRIPGTQSIIDHLVVGPAGVFSVDSERLDERLKVQIRQRGQFYHGAANQNDRVTHAREEAAQAATLIGAELGQPVQVQPVMIIYGPDVPWKIMQFEGVDIFNGGDTGAYFRRQSKRTLGRQLTPERIHQIFNAAALALPPLDETA
jgi:Nuclease-related domain